MIELLTSLVRRTRQNHGLEHATIHMLAGKANARVSGISDPWGYTLFGNLTQAQVQRAASDALLRLQAGERNLAIHPNCGTNLAVKGALAAVAALLAQAGKRGLYDQFARTLLFILPALILGEPLGYKVQALTTTGDLSDRWIVTVQRLELGPLIINRVTTE